MRAILMVGGRGERLRPLTDDRPKCMVELLGIPLLVYQLHWLRAHGYTSVVLACGYQCQFIQENLPRYTATLEDVSLQYSLEKKPLGKSGALKKTLRDVGMLAEPVLVANGDIVTDLNVTEMLEIHKSVGCVGTIAVVPLVSTMGIVSVTEEGLIQGVHEKPELPYWMNAGIYIFSPEIYDYLPDEGDESMVFPVLAERRLLFAFQSKPYYRSIDTMKDVAIANEEVANFLLKQMYRRHTDEPIEAVRNR